MRPTLKSLYPLIPIERYMEWRREDGGAFRPLAPAARARRREDRRALAGVDDDRGAGLATGRSGRASRCPEDGDYLIPGGLAPVEVRDGVGRHIEPNVWVVHEV